MTQETHERSLIQCSIQCLKIPTCSVYHYFEVTGICRIGVSDTKQATTAKYTTGIQEYTWSEELANNPQ
jgi:hypothetical protein